YAASTGPDQDFLLIGVMVSTFHSVQYIALVWAHNDRRLRSSSNEGLSRWLSRSPARYLAGCAVFGIVYFSIARATGAFPIFTAFVGARVGPFSVNQIALAFWWGLAFHHYILDQKIWRLGKDERLRSTLGVPAIVHEKRT